MIYDCFLFFNELEVLQLRLEELGPTVDQFVLVEATRTFTGNPKPLHFDDNKQRFEKHLSKIRHVIVDDVPAKYESAWDMEAHQRNAILRGLTDAAPDDIVLISDVDEIPRYSALTSFSGKLVGLELDHFYYRLNCKNLTRKWVSSAILRRSSLTSPQEARMLAHFFWKSGIPLLPNAGWHFACMQDAAGLKLKLQSFSHQECNTPALTDINSIENKIKYGLDLVDRRHFCWCCVPLDNTFPRYLLEHQDEFRHLLFDFAEFHRERQNLIYSLQDSLQEANQRFSRMKDQALRAEQQLQAALSSKSWKITEPLRAVAQMVRSFQPGRKRDN